MSSSPLPGASTQVAPARTQAGTPWWRDAVIYQIYPRSFADANGDGMGDLPGITRRLGYLKTLGIDGIWLSPFYKSPQADAGYDVADYRAVDPRFGTLADYDVMAAEAKHQGLRVIVDLVPNHTSDEHVWFRAALAAGPGSPERERYIFREGKGVSGELPPNNWESIFGGAAWTRVSDLPAHVRGEASDDEWFLHMFDVRQPDLNWEHPEVRAEFIDILKFWAGRGVDGFRIDVAHGMVKAEGLPDWDGHTVMAEGSTGDGPAAKPDKNKAPMFDQDGVHDIYREWRAALNHVNPDIALIAEAWVEPQSRMARYVRPDEMQQAFNFGFLGTGWDLDAGRAIITESLEEMGKVGATTTWVLSNHDVVRHVTRMGLSDTGKGPNGIREHEEQPDVELGQRRALALSLQMLALPGSAYLYQGEELGLPEHTSLPDEVRQDPAFLRTNKEEAGRDGCRVPIAWEANSPALGFSFGKSDASWLPQPESYRTLAADQQVGIPGSTFEVYRHAIEIRRELELGRGTLTWRDDIMDVYPTVLAFENSGILVLTNYGAEPVTVEIASSDIITASTDIIATADAVTLPRESAAWVQL